MAGDDGSVTRSRSRSRIRRQRAIGVGVILSAWLVAAAALDHIGARPLPERRYDAIVVAGAGVLPGGRPSRPLRGRVARAAELYHRGVAPRVVLTGGVGKHPPAESVVAAALARAFGVPEAALVREERSTTTEENADEAARLLGRDARIVLVTDRFHVFRATRMFRRRFATVDGVGSVCHPWPRFRGAMREVLAVAVHGLRGRL